MKNNSGFTLIEVLIAMVVSLVIMGGAYTFFNTQQRQTVIQTNVSDAQQTLRAAMDFMSRDVRMAGYDPDDAGTFSIDSIDDVNGMSAITFTWDNPNGPTSSSYSLSTVNGSTVAPNSRALMFNTGSGNEPLAGYITALGLAYAYDNNDDGELDRDVNGNIIWAVDNGGTWLYLDDNDDGQITLDDDGNGNGVLDDGDSGPSVTLDTIRAVRIWMLAQSQAPDPKYTDTKTYVVGPHVVKPNNNFRHRLLERTVLCRNMGL